MTNLAFVLWIAAIVGFVLWSIVENRKRAKAILALANRLSMKTWASQLPPELSLAGTSFAQASAHSNVIEGVQNGIPVIAFDCRIGMGKGSWRRTVIAARSSRDVFATVLSHDSYTVDHSGEWVIFYAPKSFSAGLSGLMPVAELEARLLTLGS